MSLYINLETSTSPYILVALFCWLNVMSFTLEQSEFG